MNDSQTLFPVDQLNKDIPDEFVKTESDFISDFTKELNQQPDPRHVKTNSRANNAKYLPIGIVQQQLDRIYGGLWQTRNLKTSVVANEIVVQLELGVYHPAIGDFIWRSGIGACMILQRRDADVMDISAKIKNTLHKDAPHAKAEALKNAAKSLGAIFGRDLNRDYAPDYALETERIQDAKERGKFIEEVKDGVQMIFETDGLKQYFEELMDTTPEVVKIFSDRKKEIQNGQA